MMRRRLDKINIMNYKVRVQVLYLNVFQGEYNLKVIMASSYF